MVDVGIRCGNFCRNVQGVDEWLHQEKPLVRWPTFVVKLINSINEMFGRHLRYSDKSSQDMFGCPVLRKDTCLATTNRDRSAIDVDLGNRAQDRGRASLTLSQVFSIEEVQLCRLTL